MAQYEIHEEFGHFFDDLIPHGIKNRVMIAPCGKDDAREEEQQVQPWEWDFLEDAFPWSASYEEVQAQHGKDAYGCVDRRAERHVAGCDKDRLTDIRVAFDQEYPAPGQFSESKDKKKSSGRYPHTMSGGVCSPP